MPTTEVFINNDNVTKFVSDVPEIVQSTGEFGTLIINDIPQITGINTTEFWDAQSNRSPFKGADVKGFPLRIEEEGVIIFDGRIKSILVSDDEHSATVSLRSIIQDAIDTPIRYVSENKETLAGVVQRIASLFKITIDSGSFSASIAEYTEDKAFVTANMVNADMKMIDLFQQIASMGTARIYASNSVLFFEAFEISDRISLETFTDDIDSPRVTLWSRPVPETVEKQSANGYSIDTLKGNVNTGSDTDQSLTIAGGPDSPVRIVNRPAGVALGEKKLRYINQLQNRITFEVPTTIAKSFPLGQACTIEFTTGDWDDTIVDISEVRPGDGVATTLVGLTR